MDTLGGEAERQVRRFFQISCAPRPDMPVVREMTKDEAVCRVVESFRESFPDCLVVATYLGKMGYTYNFMVSVYGEED